jgi:hypothetical protein
MNRQSKPVNPLCQNQFDAMWATLGDVPKQQRRNQMPVVKPLDLPGMPTVTRPKR